MLSSELRQTDSAYTSAKVVYNAVDDKASSIVKDYMIGNTRVKIADDFCRDVTPLEIDAILARISCRAQVHLSFETTTDEHLQT